MGNFILGSFFRRFSPTQKVRLLMFGLDSAGKTTILYRMVMKETINTIPTVGFNVDTFKYKNLEFNCWDVGGTEKAKKMLIRHYFEQTQGLIYVVDSSDRERLEESREVLHNMLWEESMQDVPVLIYANKQDRQHAMTVTQISEKLGLQNLRGRKWQIQASVASQGVGLYEGMDWMAENINTK